MSWIKASVKLPVGKKIAVNRDTGEPGEFTVIGDSCHFDTADGMRYGYSIKEEYLYNNISWWEDEKDESKIVTPEQLYKENGFDLKLTCEACPEQYEVYITGTKKQIGYLRLRHGSFRVDYPDVVGETIYRAKTKGDGEFHNDERMKYLGEAMKSIMKKISDLQSDEQK